MLYVDSSDLSSVNETEILGVKVWGRIATDVFSVTHN